MNPLPAQSAQAQLRKMLPRLPLRVATPLAGATVLRRIVRSLCTVETKTKPPPEPLSPSELDAITALIPRLVSEGRIPAAGRLLSAALLLPGSPERLPFSPLASHLASLPTLTPAFALLTALRHHPTRPSPLPLATPLVGHLISMRRARETASVLRWLCRPDSPHRPDGHTYAVAVSGLCRLEEPKDALVVLREMVLDRVRPARKVRELVRDAMLHDARIEEAWALEKTLQQQESGKIVELVDKLLGEWED